MGGVWVLGGRALELKEPGFSGRWGGGVRWWWGLGAGAWAAVDIRVACGRYLDESAAVGYVVSGALDQCVFNVRLHAAVPGNCI